MSDADVLTTAIQRHWPAEPGGKVQRYIGKFRERTRRGAKIIATVEGNHGVYTVSVTAAENRIDSACSCYIGKHGGCHHCVALGYTFLREPDSFTVLEPIVVEAAISLAVVTSLDELRRYLQGVTLDELLQQLKTKGITQKAFAESVGISSQQLGVVKRSEQRNRYFNELGALKLACVWVLQNLVGDK